MPRERVVVSDIAAEVREILVFHLGSDRAKIANEARLVDDLGAWLTSTLDRHQAWENGSVAAPVADMIAAVSAFGSTLVLVSPEVGLTVVPATASGRRFADELGTLNQRIAALCDQVVLVVELVEASTLSALSGRKAMRSDTES